MAVPYDVAVVGAGPAGTTFAAEYLDRRPEARVLLLEGIKRASTLDPSQPGAGHSMCSGGLGRHMQEIIGDVPPEVVMAEVHRAIIQSPHRTVEITADTVHSQGSIGLVLNRKKWDDWLLARARARGVEYVNGARVAYVLRADADTWALACHDGREFRAHFLVGADGPESAIARECLRAPPINGNDMFLASEVYVHAPRFPSDAILIQFHTSRLAGYYWAFSAGEGVVKVGCGTTRASAVNPSAQTTWWRSELATHYLEPGFLGRPLEAVGGRITGAPPLPHVIFPRDHVAVVGEAARAVWASIGAGDASAVETGRALARYLAQDDPQGYQRWWRKQAYPWLMRHYRLKNLLLGLDDEQLDRLATIMATYQPRGTDTRREVPRLFSHILRSDPRLLGATARAMLRS